MGSLNGNLPSRAFLEGFGGQRAESFMAGETIHHDTSQKNPRNSPLISREQLAAELKVSVRTLDRYHSLRTGPPRISFGKKRFYRRDAVLKWLEQNETSF